MEARSVPAAALQPPEPFRRLVPDVGPPRSGKATASLIFGIVGVPLMGLLTGWVAILFGALALRDIRRASHAVGRNLAVAGVVLGIFDIVLWLVLFAIYGSSIFVPRFRPVPAVPAPAPHVAILG